MHTTAVKPIFSNFSMQLIKYNFGLSWDKGSWFTLELN
jgi:hypothetical protein